MRLYILAISTALIVLSPLSAQSGTWYIKVDGTGDAPTIQAGVDSAVPNDTVLVASGTYTWTSQGTSGFWFILIMDKEVCLRSESGPEMTVLDAEGEGRVIGVGSHGTSIIEGFTITGGWADEMTGGGYGAGLFLSYADPRIANNIVTGNIAMNNGGAMYCGYSAATITGNIIAGNNASNDAGGIYCDHSDIVITGNTFVGNSADVAGGVFCRDSNPTISNNIVTGSLGGSALYCDGSSFPTVTCNDFWNNAGGAGNCALGGDNFSADPLFCDAAAGDFRLDSCSPCAPGNSPASCGLVGALPVGCGDAPLGAGTAAIITIALGAAGAWRITRSGTIRKGARN